LENRALHYESCLLEKMAKSPFVGQSGRASELSGLIHTDECGLFFVMARAGYHYFITFTDNLSRYGYVYLMKYKSKCFEKFKEFKVGVENQIGKSIKIFRSDRGGEYLSTKFNEYLKANAIISQLTPLTTPQLNGVSKRINHTLLDMVHSMIAFVNLPLSMWGYALCTTIYLHNRAPSKSVKSTPYEIWTERQHSLKHIRIWGRPTYVNKLKTDKLESSSSNGKFVGNPEHCKWYYVYFPN